MKKDFGRILLPFITPFKDNEEVDYDAFAELIEYAIKKDFLDSIVVTGTTGEFNVLTFDERVKLFETAVKTANGRVPVIAGTGCGSTKETVALTNAAVKAGIKDCLIVAPYYSKPNQSAIYDHYVRIYNETTANIIIYNIPIFTGVNIEPALLGKLCAYGERFIGVKDESGINPGQITEYFFAVQDKNPDFLIYNGDDVMLMPTIATGAMGIVSGGSLILGDRVKKVFENYYAGNHKESLRLYREIFKFCKVCSIGGRTHPNSVLREAVELVTKIKVGKPRMPLNGLNKEEKEELIKVLKEIKLI